MDKDETQHETIEEHKPSWVDGITYVPDEEVWRKSRMPTITPSSFYQLLKEIGDLHHKKQQDYGTTGDPFANIRGSQEWGIRPWVGAMVRAQDKIKRIQKYAREGNLANESVRDSFMDLAVYALIACILHEEEINAN